MASSETAFIAAELAGEVGQPALPGLLGRGRRHPLREVGEDRVGDHPPQVPADWQRRVARLFSRGSG